MPRNTVQDAVQAASLSDPESFWAHHADQLYWHKKPATILKQGVKRVSADVQHEHWSWFPDGEISTTYNCVDRHVEAGHGDHLAVIWDSPVTQTKQTFTYTQLLHEVELLAAVLREEGVRKGDVVLIYMPMIPAALFAMLATVRLGAIHAVVFGGFAPASLAQRIDSARPKLVMTASCAIEGTKGPLDYRPLVEGGLEKSAWKPEKTMIWQRDQTKWYPIAEKRGQRDWQNLVASAHRRGVEVKPVPVKGNEGLYIIYTSGTTGAPKGVLREAGGHAVGLSLSIKYLFDVRGPGDVMLCASDIGWVVGHSYIVYAPLLVGATTILYEGKPIGTPDAGAFWRMVEEHSVTALFTAPTALRAIRKEDPQNRFFEQVGRRGGLKHWRGLFLAGERSEPSIVSTFQNLLARYAAPDAQVIDNWWSSESGSPITGLALRPATGVDAISSKRHRPLQAKPGSAGKPMPGFDVRIVDDDGIEVKQGSMGNIVLGMPLAPSGFTTLFNDDVRFYKGYLKRFNGRWVDTGDAGMIDDDGYVHVMSRSDDIINVAAHRFSTGSIEQAILSHPAIAEACVVGIPDEMKGHLPFAFVSPTSTSTSSSTSTDDDDLFKSLNNLVRTQIGPIATLGGMIINNNNDGAGNATAIIPKTRSGKTVRRVLRELVENGVRGEYGKEVAIPATIEDGGHDVVDNARLLVRQYFEGRKKEEKKKKKKEEEEEEEEGGMAVSKSTSGTTTRRSKL